MQNEAYIATGSGSDEEYGEDDTESNDSDEAHHPLPYPVDEEEDSSDQETVKD